MAKLFIYNLYDETIETYVAQYMNTHDNLMRRDCERIYETSKNAYAQSPMSPQAGLYKYASNYMIYKTAEFDDQTGIYTSLDVKEPLLNFGVFQLAEKDAEIKDNSEIITK